MERDVLDFDYGKLKVGFKLPKVDYVVVENEEQLVEITKAKNERFYELSNLHFKFDLTLTQDSPISRYELDNCIIQKLIIVGELSKAIHVQNCIIESVKFKGAVYERQLWFRECCIEEIYFDPKTKLDYVAFVDCVIGLMAIVFGSIKFMDVEMSEKAKNLPVIHQLYINLDGVSGQFIFKPQIEIKSLTLRGFLKNDTILQFINSKLSWVDIHGVTNQGLLKIQDCEADPNSTTAFLIETSDLGKAEFINLDLSAFTNVIFQVVNLTSSVFNNVQWPKFIQTPKNVFPPGRSVSQVQNRIKRLSRYPETFGDTSWESQRETNRQLKHAMAKQGDTINEQHFHMLEMNAYAKTLKGTNKRGTRLILQLSNFTSSYGQSIWKPFWQLIVAQFILMLLAIAFHSFPDLRFSYKHASWAGFNKAAYYFFYYINPLHRPIAEVFMGWTIIINLLMRIIASYMIYNFVRASRRFLK